MQQTWMTWRSDTTVTKMSTKCLRNSTCLPRINPAIWPHSEHHNTPFPIGRYGRRKHLMPLLREQNATTFNLLDNSETLRAISKMAVTSTIFYNALHRGRDGISDPHLNLATRTVKISPTLTIHNNPMRRIKKATKHGSSAILE